MGKRTYVFKNDFAAPYAVATGIPHKPTALKLRKFKKGDMINGEMKHSNDRPALVLVDGVLPIPLHVIKEVLTKEIVQGANGEASIQDSAGLPEPPKKTAIVIKKDKKLRLIDMAIVGAVVGFAGVYFAEKKLWIATPNLKYKIAGAVGGAMLFAYVAYRIQNMPKVEVPE
jgi:hypothetical protein